MINILHIADCKKDDYIESMISERPDIIKESKKKKNTTFVAFFKEKTVGIIIVFDKDQTVEDIYRDSAYIGVLGIGVEPHEEGMRLAQRLVDVSCALHCTDGVNPIMLVDSHEKDAEFYEQNNFIKNGEPFAKDGEMYVEMLRVI